VLGVASCCTPIFQISSITEARRRNSPLCSRRTPCPFKVEVSTELGRSFAPFTREHSATSRPRKKTMTTILYRFFTPVAKVDLKKGPAHGPATRFPGPRSSEMHRRAASNYEGLLWSSYHFPVVFERGYGALLQTWMVMFISIFPPASMLRH